MRALLAKRGALFFPDLVAETGAFAGDLVAALWDLVWAGEITNDTLAPLRSLLAGTAPKARTPRPGPVLSLPPAGPPGSEGRWFLVPAPRKPPTDTERRAALSRALLERHGVLTREAVAAEGIAGGFSTVYPVLKAMEEAGQVRRGYFVAGLGATQFALAGADDRLRGEREAPEPEAARTLVLAATDPANPYGAALRWPASSASDAPPGRSAPPAPRWSSGPASCSPGSGAPKRTSSHFFRRTSRRGPPRPATSRGPSRDSSRPDAGAPSSSARSTAGIPARRPSPRTSSRPDSFTPPAATSSDSRPGQPFRADSGRRIG